MKNGLLKPDVLITLKGIPVSPPSLSEDGTLSLDALMPLADIVRSPLICEKAPLLVESAISVASNQVRHIATLGGNLCLETRCGYYNQSHTFQFIGPCFKRGGDSCYLLPKGKRCQAVFMGDTVPALTCLDAKVEIQSRRGSRQVPIMDLYTGDSLSPLTLSGDDIVRKILVPPAAPTLGTAFTKYSIRGGVEFGALNVAALLALGDDGKHVERARVVVGCIGARISRAFKAESTLLGETPGEAVLDKAAKEVAAELRPVMHHDFSVPFLRECLRVQAHRTLVLATKRISRK
jgi:CO/xanthine dehydrogenase FAD-binding subunit